MNQKMLIANCGDLWEMCDYKNLPFITDQAELSTERVRGGSTDAAVNLIKNINADGITGSDHPLDREGETGEFSSTGDLVKGHRGLSGVRADLQRNPIEPPWPKELTGDLNALANRFKTY